MADINLANFDYSLKNIPTPSNDNYLRGVIVQCEKFLQRLRWKVYHFLKDPNKSEEPKTTQKENDKNKNIQHNDTEKININFGFRTPENAPQPKELVAFENSLNYLISNLKYKNSQTNEFQKKLKKDVNYIRNSKKIFVKADKTNNIYEVEPSLYSKLLDNNIKANYKKVDNNVINDINKGSKKCIEVLNPDLTNRVEKITPKNSYITIKDHKQEFPNKIQCRLINPTKTNIGKISKQILEKINNEIIKKTNLRLLKNSKAAIDWFISKKPKKELQFLQIDIQDYYPSINKKISSSIN